MTPGPNDAAGRQKPAVLKIWQHRNFTLFMSGIGPYYITSWMQRVGIMWLAWELTKSPAWLGVVAAADLAPMLFLGPIGGAFVDRNDPVRIIKICMILMALQAIALASLTLAGWMTIEILFLLALMTGLILPFYSACRQIIVATTVPRTEFASAIAMDSSFFHGSRFIGPAIAAITIPWFGVGGTFVAHIFGSLLFFAFQSLMAVTPTDRSTRPKSSLLRDVNEGFAYAYRHPGIWPIFILMTTTSVAVRPLQDMLAGFAGGVYNSDATGLAWLASGMGVGALASAVWLALRGTVVGLTQICISGCLLLAGVTLIFCQTDVLWIGVVFAALIGFALNGMATTTHTLVQNAVADEMRGRVVGLYSLIYRGTPAVGALAIGVFAEAFGLQMSFTISAAICLIAWIIIMPHRRRVAAALEESKT